MRDAAPYFEEVPDISAPKDMTELAKVIIERMSGHFDASEFVDRYEEALVGMLKEKQAGHRVVASEAPKPRNVVNLMDALKRSVEEEAKKNAGASKQASEKSPTRARAASKERKPASPKPAKRRAKGWEGSL